MGFHVCVLIAVIIMLLIPFVRFFIKRVSLFFRIKRKCKKAKYKIKGTHPLWFLGNRNRKEIDLLVETETEILSVKLFGTFRNNTRVIITENGDYFIRKYHAFLSSKSQVILFTDSKPKPFTNCDFGIEKNFSEKRQRKILIIDPVYLEIFHQPKYGNNDIIDSGDMLFGMEIYTGKSFSEKLLKNK